MTSQPTTQNSQLQRRTTEVFYTPSSQIGQEHELNQAENALWIDQQATMGEKTPL